MTILAIETSCDETSVGIVRKTKNRLELLSNIISSSLSLHAKTGGIIPEVAAREQIKLIIPVIEQALENCKLKIENLDSIAVTYGPGLLGSLLVGVETAKTLSFVFNKPLVPVNHLLGHIYANWINQDREIKFPALSLIVSGGHTDLVLIKNHNNLKWLGGTRDDAAGEAYDKIGRLLNLPYPGGPSIEKAAQNGNINSFNFPKPLIDSDDYDFSFSGLKTAVLREVQAIDKLNDEIVSNICSSVQEAIVEVLVNKTLKAAKKFNAQSVLLGGGVAANQKLRDELQANVKKINIELFIPPKSLCTDNGAMIAAAAFFNNDPISWKNLSANPQLYFD